MVRVEPSALNGHRVWINVGCNHLELAGTERGQLCNQILVPPALFEQVSDFLYVLGLGESSDEGGICLSKDFVVYVTDILCSKNARYAVFSGLFENQFDEVFCRRVSGMRGEIRCNFIHEEKKFEFSFSRLLR